MSGKINAVADGETDEVIVSGFQIKKAPNYVKKQKQLLAYKLKTFFQIEGDPFENYKKKKAYQIKIKLDCSAL